MTREFGSLGEMATHMAGMAVRMYVQEQAGLERALRVIEKKAKSEFGVYQPSTGPFPAWPELAETTKDDRLRHGYTENDPLLRSGALRASSSHEVQGLEGVAGSKDPVMAYQEFGTPTIPARPVWGPAEIQTRDTVARILAAVVINGIAGGDAIHPALGYDQQIRPVDNSAD